ncbi:MAG: hypothetical protein IT428_08445 [Planctomycetaceae bacterium]|nr:hypothetical protein [Planctomycetaceae bacterium]
MIELSRRILLMVGLLGAVAFALWSPSAVVALRPEHPRAWQESRARFRWWADESRKEDERGSGKQAASPTREFIARYTEGRLIRVDGDAWRTLFDQMHVEMSSGSPTGERAKGAEQSTPLGDSPLFLPADDQRVADARAWLANQAKTFAFLELPTERGPLYASISVTRPHDVRNEAPTEVRYPHCDAAVWWLVGGLLAYALLPWPRRSRPDALRYSRVSAVILPDLLAAVLGAFFFGLPFLIVGANTTTSELFDFADSGWGFLTATLWLLAAIIASIFPFSAWYAAFEAVIEPERLSLTTLWGADDIVFRDVEAIETAEFRPPRWLRTLAFAASLVNPRMLGQAMLLSSRSDAGLVVRFRDGRRRRLLMSALPGGERIIAAFRAAGVEVREPANDECDG